MKKLMLIALCAMTSACVAVPADSGAYYTYSAPPVVYRPPAYAYIPPAVVYRPPAYAYIPPVHVYRYRRWH